MLERFATHNLPIFERNGITLVGAWVPLEESEADRLVYLVRFPSKPAAEKAWAGFSADPEWKRVFAAEKETHGTVVSNVETVYLAPTDYSPEPTPAEPSGSGDGHAYILRTYTARAR